MSVDANSKIIKVNEKIAVDEGHGVVVGWAIVCKIDGVDYYDLNVDAEGIHKGKAVPEHIPEDTMFKAWADAADGGAQMPGNDMHQGPDTGVYYSLFPVTTEIAASLGMITKNTGLLCAYKPAPEVLAKFKDGTYTGFSIEGARIKSEEVADA